MTTSKKRKLRNAVRRKCVKIECKLFCKPIKSQSKTTKTRFCQLIHKNYSYWRQNLDRYWTKRIFNSISEYEVSKKLIHLLRHGNLHREDDGAVELWRKKIIFRIILCFVIIGLTKWKSQYCADSSGTILNLRALQSHSRRKVIDPSLQDNVFIPDGFFEYIYHIGCAIDLNSIINSGLIPGVQNLSKRQTIFFLLVNPMDKEHKDPETIDLKAPRVAQYMHTTWKKHQNTVYWVNINIALKKGSKFYIKHDRTLSFFTKHSQLIVSRKLFGWKLEESNTRKYLRHLVPSSEDFLDTWPDERMGFRSCSTTRGRSCSTIQKLPIKPTKSKPRSW